MPLIPHTRHAPLTALRLLLGGGASWLRSSGAAAGPAAVALPALPAAAVAAAVVLFSGRHVERRRGPTGFALLLGCAAAVGALSSPAIGLDSGVWAATAGAITSALHTDVPATSGIQAAPHAAPVARRRVDVPSLVSLCVLVLQTALRGGEPVLVLPSAAAAAAGALLSYALGSTAAGESVVDAVDATGVFGSLSRAVSVVLGTGDTDRVSVRHLRIAPGDGRGGGPRGDEADEAQLAAAIAASLTDAPRRPPSRGPGAAPFAPPATDRVPDSPPGAPRAAATPLDDEGAAAVSQESVARLLGLGLNCNRDEAVAALRAADGNVDMAAVMLMGD